MSTPQTSDKIITARRAVSNRAARNVFQVMPPAMAMVKTTKEPTAPASVGVSSVLPRQPIVRLYKQLRNEIPRMRHAAVIKTTRQRPPSLAAREVIKQFRIVAKGWAKDWKVEGA